MSVAGEISPALKRAPPPSHRRPVRSRLTRSPALDDGIFDRHGRCPVSRLASLSLSFKYAENRPVPSDPPGRSGAEVNAPMSSKISTERATRENVTRPRCLPPLTAGCSRDLATVCNIGRDDGSNRPSVDRSHLRRWPISGLLPADAGVPGLPAMRTPRRSVSARHGIPRATRTLPIRRRLVAHNHQ